MKTIKSVLFSGFLFTILFSCALKPTEIEKEKKDYQGTIHNVENANYEFEERLNSFYESEHIASKDLDTLYKGEYPDGDTDANALRIHWQKARELAIAELELQKAIQTNWQEAKISLRPVLALDRDGGDYYRYYEYRILKDDNAELGAIRIPVYRRTENFTTSEVHVYSSDGKTYKIEPTMWGSHISLNSLLESGNPFYSKIFEDIVVLSKNKNFSFNWYYRFLANNDAEAYLENVSFERSYNMIYSKMSDTIKQVSIPGRTSLTQDKLNYITAFIAKSNEKAVANHMTSTLRFFSLSEAASKLANQYGSGFIIGKYMVSFENILKRGIDDVLKNMSYRKKDNFLYIGISNIYWEIIEKYLNSTTPEFRYALLNETWILGKNLSDEGIYPKIDFNQFNQFPGVRYSDGKYFTDKFYCISKDDFDSYTHPTLSFISKEGKEVTFKSQDSYGGYPQFIIYAMPEEVNRMRASRAVSYVNIDEIEKSINDIVSFASKMFSKDEDLIRDEITTFILSGLFVHNKPSSVEDMARILENLLKDVVNGMQFAVLLEVSERIQNLIETTDVLKNLPIGTLGIHLASGVADKYLKDTYKTINDNMSSITKLYNWIVSDYDRLIDLVYKSTFNNNNGGTRGERLAKEAVNQLYISLKVLESLVNAQDAKQGIIDAYRTLVKKWLIWYFPLVPFPTGHWRTYKHGYAKLLPELTMPLAYAQYWIDINVGTVPKPTDDDSVGSFIPESIDIKYQLQCSEVSSWRDEQVFMEDENLPIDILSTLIEKTIAILEDIYANGVINGELPAIDKQDETIVYWPTEEQMNKELERRMNGEYVDFVKEKIGDVPIGNFKLSTSGVLE